MPRVLIITDQPDFGRQLAHHISVFWDDAGLTVHSPARQGEFHRAFSAAGYDMVLVDDAVMKHTGREMAARFAVREGVPPLLLFTDKADVAPIAQQDGVPVTVLPRERITNRRLAEAMREANDRHKRNLAQLTRQEVDRRYQFGEVVIRGMRFIEEIGKGGTSRVYLAESEKAGEVVVLKVLNHNPDAAESSEGYDRFLQEYELLSHIRHPNVVRIHDFGLADDHAFIAMEYFENGDMRRRLSEPMTVGETLNYVEQIARALSAVHNIGVLHRDLKPGNVMLRNDGSLALIDFGVAKQLEAGTSITSAGTIFGTPYYMSPEQGHGEQVDARSDLYSLGVMFYEMLMQKRPYSSSTVMNVIYMHRNAPLPELSQEYSWMEPTIHRLMAKNPKHRYQTAAEVISAVGLMRLMAETVSLSSSRVGL
ncbi:MAG TPA: serine/threonine-protein kinase [Steroidobacteraceae bacterium]|nr:serine/threonine-protein kinase [Steroidobacteraceae bacterium]